MALDSPPPDGGPPPPLFPELQGFSLVLGGPLYQLLRKARLDDDVGSHLKRRLVAICGLIWLPLLLLSAVEGRLLGGVDIPFLIDIETHARFLVAVPLMIVAELLVHRRMRGIVAQFVERKLVPQGAMGRFRATIASAMAWRNSIPAEVGLIFVVLTLGYYVRTDPFALEASTWYARPALAGLWFTWVSNPIQQFLFLRWLFRIVIWARLLWQISRIELDLIPTHPDRNAGLGFLGASAYLFAPLLAAISAMVSGLFASRIFHEGASLTDFKLEIVTLIVLGAGLVLGPMTVFAPRILAARRIGLKEYGAFAAGYMRDFDRRWLRTAGHDGEELLGSGDIQSLADLGTAFTVVREIKAVPFGRDTLLQIVWATLAPIAPLVFTMIPLEQLLDRILGAVL